MTIPLLAVSIGENLGVEIVSGRHDALRALLAHPAVAFAVTGAERDPLGPGIGADPSIVAATLISYVPDGAGVLVAGRPGADHPYNLARRILSLDHLSHGRSGVLFAGVDRRGSGQNGWIPTADDDTLLRETATILDELFAAWPLDAFPADQQSGQYVDTDRVQHIGFEGAYSVLGPLTAPGSSQGLPLRAQLVPPGRAALPGLDIVVREGDDPIADAEEAAFTLRHRPVSAWSGTEQVSPDGVLLTVDSSEDIATVLDALGRPHGRHPAGTLRDRIGIPAPRILLDHATPAFLEGSTR